MPSVKPIHSHRDLRVADLLIAVVATDADDLYRVVGLVLAVPGVERTTMSVAMHEVVAHRTRPLLEQLARRRSTVAETG
jgi:DNA-binding Lrp family transcriptional regulator